MRFKYLIFFSTTLFASPGFYEPWGKDTNLTHMPAPKAIAEKRSIPIRMADVVIRFHQTVISPVDGPRSHYRPSSSQYMQQAMHNYGFLKGFLMGCDRLLRENDEEWVYRKIEENGQIFKYDPAKTNKYE